VIAKPLAAITAADIQGLVAERTPEGRSIEFKRELPGAKDSDRKEFLADVSSFANALGGDLIFGVQEKDGVAAVANGVVVANIDAEVLRLDEMIRSGISPRIIGCHTQVVPELAKGPAVVIRIPRSWNGPHAISFQQDFPFYSRSTKGKFRMDASDVRDAVLAAGSIDERIRTSRHPMP
jgi:predicted HTH transcriptional regulator